MLAHAGTNHRTQLSTLVRPLGQGKTIPLVVHTAGNTVYEEPCLAVIHMHVTKVMQPLRHKHQLHIPGSEVVPAILCLLFVASLTTADWRSTTTPRAVLCQPL